MSPESGNAGMEELIPIVNKLHDVFTQMGPDVQFDLPQIAVVGGQSAGKSSVLENFVGRDFLPRGSGIVTRRPLILQLINSTHEWGQFLHCKEKRFTNFDDIRKEIEVDTERVTGTNKGISNLPINLRIYSPHVLNITLIDLPGLTRNPIGDQPEDIETQIRDMIFEYISKDTCLILAVTPANVDLGTSDALKLAKTVDPEGLRTIGVITKLDLMDAGTDASDILQNKCLPLRRGYVGIVNRSQKDIDGRKDIKAAQEAEKRFFQTHAAYKGFANKMGTPYLQRVLNEQLTAHIRECLPALKAKLRNEKAALEKIVESSHLDDPGFKTKELHNLIHQLQSDFRTTIRGYGNVGTNELSGGVKINYLFHEGFAADLEAQTQHDEQELKRQILFAVRNSHGIEMGIFTPNMAFQTIVKGQIMRLKDPTLNCVDLVTKEFSRTLLSCVAKMNHYPNLCEEMEYIISNFIVEHSESCKGILTQLLESEASYINTKHEEFIVSTRAQGEERIDARAESKEEGIQNLAKGYLTVLNNNILKGGAKPYWFVLTSMSLSWYKDESEGERKSEVRVKGLNFRDETGGTLTKRTGFTLFFPNGRPLSRDFAVLSVGTDSPQDTERWRVALLKAGVKYQNSNGEDVVANGSTIWHDPLTATATTTVPGSSVRRAPSPNLPVYADTDWTSHYDSQLEKQVETIRHLVDTYMSIVTRTSRDLVPKIITNFIIKKTQDFIDGELLAQINKQDPEILMGVSKEEVARRSAILRTYKACQESLEIINQITVFTSTSARTEVQGLTGRANLEDWKQSSFHNKMIAPEVPRRPASVANSPVPERRVLPVKN